MTPFAPMCGRPWFLVLEPSAALFHVSLHWTSADHDFFQALAVHLVVHQIYNKSK